MLSPIIFVLRLSNSGLIRAIYPSSVVQTGVKSLGWENSTHHESPIHSWKRIRPSVVSAPKSGAVSPILRVISLLLLQSLDLWWSDRPRLRLSGSNGRPGGPLTLEPAAWSLNTAMAHACQRLRGGQDRMTRRTPLQASLPTRTDP